jgi:hypothetical protein
MADRKAKMQELAAKRRSESELVFIFLLQLLS